MNKKFLIDLINEIFDGLGFTRKNNKWIAETPVLFKHIELQKSSFSNSYYINYGFSIKELDLTRFNMHIYNRVSSTDKSENGKVINALDLEMDISIEKRSKILVHNMNPVRDILASVNNVIELEGYLKKRNFYNDIPLIVKEYLNIPIS